MGSVLLQEDEESLSPLSCLRRFVARHCRMWCWKHASSAAALPRRIRLLNLLKLLLKAMAVVLEKKWVQINVGPELTLTSCMTNAVPRGLLAGSVWALMSGWKQVQLRHGWRRGKGDARGTNAGVISANYSCLAGCLRTGSSERTLWWHFPRVLQ